MWFTDLARDSRDSRDAQDARDVVAQDSGPFPHPRRRFGNSERRNALWLWMPGILLFLFRGFQRNFLGILVFFSRNLVEIAAISSCFFFGGGYWLQKFPLVHMLEILSYWVILGMLPGILDVMNDSIWFLLVPDVDLEIQLMFSSSREAKWVSDHWLMTNGILEILQTSA